MNLAIGPSVTSPRQLANAKRASVVAPAGFGKTHLVCEAVSEFATGRQLVLTHTHAGVRSIRTKLATLDCDRELASVETIDGWALRYALAFPGTSGVSGYPTTDQDWRELREGAARVLELGAVQRMLRLSYEGCYVDEYQDCTVSQHVLVEKIADVVACRVVGDPLQGIFDFAADPAPTWSQVEASFPALDQLSHPWRWEGKNEALGIWLQELRTQLESLGTTSLRNPPAGVSIREKTIGDITSSCGDVGRRSGDSRPASSSS